MILLKTRAIGIVKKMKMMKYDPIGWTFQRWDFDFEISSDLGFRNIGRNYDWASDLRLRCPNLDLAVIPNFIQQVRKSTNVDNVNVPYRNVPYRLVKSSKSSIFEWEPDEMVFTNPERVDPLRLIVLGTAGTGKSYLIKMIQDRNFKRS